MLDQFLELPKLAKPFKFLNHWGKHREFVDTIQTVWNTISPGRSNHLDQKLRSIKEACKAKFKNTEAGDLAKAEVDLQKSQEDLHLHPRDKHLADVEYLKLETYRRLKVE